MEHDWTLRLCSAENIPDSNVFLRAAIAGVVAVHILINSPSLIEFCHMGMLLRLCFFTGTKIGSLRNNGGGGGGGVGTR